MFNGTQRNSGRAANLASFAIALALAATACAGGDDGAAARSPLDSIVPAAPPVTLDFALSGGDPEPRPADSPSAAVEQFLAAERAGDPVASYTSLATASRGVVGSLEEWADGALGRPTVLSYEIEASPANPAGDVASVRADVTYEPRLDEVVGLVPGAGTVEWFVRAEPGGWLVDVAATTVLPVLPVEAGAARAAAAWAGDKQACRDAAANEYGGSLLGSPSVGDALCGTTGEPSVGTATAVGDAIATSVVAAFGPDALTWTRTVPVTVGSSPISVVLAPLGERWLVVGVGT